MSDIDPKSLIRAFIDSLNRSHPQDPYEFLATDVVITINGTTPLSGRFEGLPLVQKILVDTAVGVIKHLHVKIHRLIGKGTTVAALLEVKGTAQNGSPFNDHGDLCGCVFDVQGKCITAIRAFPDTSMIDMTLFGWKFVPNRTT